MPNTDRRSCGGRRGGARAARRRPRECATTAMATAPVEEQVRGPNDQCSRDCAHWSVLQVAPHSSGGGIVITVRKIWVTAFVEGTLRFAVSRCALCTLSKAPLLSQSACCNVFIWVTNISRPGVSLLGFLYFDVNSIEGMSGLTLKHRVLKCLSSIYAMCVD